MYKYIFGPVLSRRFGLSLGIDLSPDKKSCNFDCLYCELEKAKPVNKIENQPNPDEIIKELRDYLSKNQYPDVITVTANGEPTLYSKLDELIEKINQIKGNSKSLILSNASTINEISVRQALKKFDIVKLSLDAADQKTFEKIDKPLKGIKIEDIIDGMISFRKEYSGTLVLEVLIVKHINDKKEVIEKIVEAVKKINPDRIDISTIDRPPAYRVFPVDNQTLYEIASMFEGLNVNVATRKSGGKIKKVHLDKEDILNTFKKRAYTVYDIETLFDEDTKENINQLLLQGKLKTTKVANLEFIKTS
ncbi:radical SAM protein [Sulfurihydrogenibium sp.]|uniref:radical SAM protein n=1 Tax=Sulfurihydrogenibium sp. TaxID=2053621 RepID=UPI00260AEB8C|nr:radical SAM protein [Sulfurihydrogenibium sp.]